jgi:hypothetical protein
MAIKPVRDKDGKFAKQKGYLFSRIAQNIPVGYEKDISEDARRWFRDTALSINRVAPDRLFEHDDTKKLNSVDQSMIGKLVMFWYDAKTKAELPYWDKLPVAFPIEIYSDGFLGINLHYLPPLHRAKLMDALYTTINTKSLNENSKLRISYRILKGVSKFSAFEPCIKRYLFSHVQSPFMSVEAPKWDIMVFLPLARWQKTGAETVWRDSMNRITKFGPRKKK